MGISCRTSSLSSGCRSSREERRLVSCTWFRPFIATSGLVPEIVGSSFSFFVNGDVLPAFSGEGVNRCPRLGEGTAEEGGVSFKVSLFLGDVLTPSLVPGKSSLLLAPPPPWDKAASLARCICCLRGVWLMWLCG